MNRWSKTRKNNTANRNPSGFCKEKRKIIRQQIKVWLWIKDSSCSQEMIILGSRYYKIVEKEIVRWLLATKIKLRKGKHQQSLKKQRVLIREPFLSLKLVLKSWSYRIVKIKIVEQSQNPWTSPYFKDFTKLISLLFLTYFRLIWP